MSNEPVEREPIERVHTRLDALANRRMRLLAAGLDPADGQAVPGGGHAERAMQGSWRQEHGTTHARGPRAEQAGKLEARLLFPRSQGRTLARTGGSACAPLSAHHGIAGAKPGLSVRFSARARTHKSRSHVRFRANRTLSRLSPNDRV